MADEFGDCVCVDGKLMLNDKSCADIVVPPPVPDACEDKPYIYTTNGSCTDACGTGFYLDV